MELERWLVYASIVLIVIVAPGPAALLCMSHGLEHGRTRTIATIAGLLSSSLVLISLSALGVGTALAASAFLFDVIRYVGAAYLAYLGISVWRSTGASPAPNALPSFESVTRKGRSICSAQVFSLASAIPRTFCSSVPSSLSSWTRHALRCSSC